MILIAALLAAATAFVLSYTLVSPGRPRAVTVRLGQFERIDAITDREALLATPFASRVGIPAWDRARNAVLRLLPGSLASTIEERLIVAGEPISLHAFLAVQAAAGFAAVVVLLLGLASGPEGLAILAVLLLPLMIGLAPLYWLRLKVSARKKAILKELPDAVDLIVTTVEAGMSIDGALAEVGGETTGPLGEELRLAIRETTLGRSRRDALERLIFRTQVPELRTFVQSIIQAEQTGIPIGQVLRTQAAQIRLKKRQWAEAEAQRAPVKMVIVLVLLVLPAMLLMVMGPAMIRLGDRL